MSADCLHASGSGKNLYLELSVHENVDFMARLFGLSATGARPASRTAQCHRTCPFPERPAGKLSGGMKQRWGSAALWFTNRIFSSSMSPLPALTRSPVSNSGRLLTIFARAAPA